MDAQTAAVVAGWRRADERLYPVVMVDPERYTRIVSVVRDAADRLGEHDTVADLVEVRAHGRQLVALSCAAVGVPVEILSDVEAVADAAFSLRHREIEAAGRRQRRAAKVSAARTRGDPWVTLDESGRADEPAVAPYQRIDMCLANGTAIRAAVDVNPDSYQPLYSIEHLLLDPQTGAVIRRLAERDPPPFDDPAPWNAAAARWRAEAARRAEGP